MKYATGDNIPQVAIQPSASPVSANVLPAAGQPIRGANELMQIAEAMAPFNQGLMAFGKRVVDIDNENAAMAGGQLNFNGVASSVKDPAQRAADLNKQFKDVVERSGASDAANPYFQLAARQNFGRKLGLDYRAAIYQMKERVTDPDNPIPYAQASAEALQNVLGTTLDGDFYGFQGFKEVAQKTDSEMMMRFTEEAIQRKETKGALIAKSAVMEAISHGDVATADKAWGDYQTRVTDPVKVRANFVGTAKDALMSAQTLDDLHKRADSFRSMRYGNQTVHDNMDLMSELVQFEDQARVRILAKTEQDAKLNDIAFESGKRTLYGSGFINDAMRQVETNGAEIAGGNYPDWVNRQVDDLAEKNKWSTEVTERVREFALGRMQSILAQSSAMSETKAREAAKSIQAGITSNALPTEEAVQDACAAAGVPPDETTRLIALRAQRSGPVQTAFDQSIEGVFDRNIGLLSSHFNSNGLMPFGLDNKPTASNLLESNRIASQVSNALRLATNSFISGQVKDEDGNYFDHYQKQGPQQAAAAVRRFASSKNTDLLKAEFDRADQAVAAGKRVINGAYVAAKKPEDLADTNWKSIGPLGDLAKKVTAGTVTVNSQNPPAELSTVYKSTLDRLSHDYEVGWFSNGTVDQIRTTIAQQLFKSMQLPPGENIRTQSREIIGGALWLVGGLSQIVLGEESGMGVQNSIYDYFSTFKNTDQIREDYATIMRLHGMTLDHILHDRDQEGLPVFGLTLPRSPDELRKAAFSIPLVQSLEELKDTAKVSAVLRQLGLSDNEIPQFVEAQSVLFQLRKLGISKFGSDTASLSTTSQGELDAAKSSYYLYLESAKAKSAK